MPPTDIDPAAAREPDVAVGATTLAPTVFAQPKQVVRTLALRAPMQSERSLRVAAPQFDPILGEVGRNAERVCGLIEQCANNSAQLVVFPECALTGFNFSSREDALACALAPDADELRDIAKVCAAHDVVAVVGGLLRAEGDAAQVTNSALVFAPGGEMIRRDKARLSSWGADEFAVAGAPGAGVVELSIVNLGVLIGGEANAPEPARGLAREGARLVAVPSAWTSAEPHMPDFLASARAFESGVFVVACNRVGAERGWGYIGRSCIVAPDGRHLADAAPDEEHIIIADVDLSETVDDLSRADRTPR